MAFTRKMLKAYGIEDNIIEQIMDAHVEVVDALKAERDGYKTDAEKLPGVQKELDTLKASGGDWRSKYEKEHTDFETYKTEIGTRDAKAAKVNAYRTQLREAGIPEKKHDAILRVADLDSIEMGEDGTSFKDSSAVLDGIKTEWAEFIPTVTKTGAAVATPPSSDGTGVTRESIMAIKDRTERRKAIAENMNLFQ